MSCVACQSPIGQRAILSGDFHCVGCNHHDTFKAICVYQGWQWDGFKGYYAHIYHRESEYLCPGCKNPIQRISVDCTNEGYLLEIKKSLPNLSEREAL